MQKSDISQIFRTFASGMKRILQILGMWVCMCYCSVAICQSFALEDVLEDICNQLSEEGEVPIDQVQEELLEIASHPINLNHTSADELKQLLWLSDEQIDAILLYGYEHAFADIYELQLIDCLKDYDIRNLLPFVYVGKVEEEREKMYIRDVFHHAKHEVTMRGDVRNAEDYEGDPVYAKLRYRFDYQGRVQAGLTVGRTPGAAWDEMGLGAYIQLRDIGVMKRLVAGNYQATYGYGLVVGSPLRRGKTAYIQSTATTDEGLKKFGSVGDGYNHFHGIGATMKVGKGGDVSAFYSLGKEEEQWRHVVGVNATKRWRRVKIGLTATENIYAGDAQAVIGANMRYNNGKIDVWGEVATAQGERWGWAGIGGLRYTPLSDINLLAIYRYYSEDFHNEYANALCSHTRINNEHGGYVGIEFNRLKNWQLSAYGDIWKEGYEVLVQGDWNPQKNYRMHTRFRIRSKDEKDNYSLRWNMVYMVGRWKMKTQADGNLVKGAEGLTYGWSVMQDVEYRFVQVPIVVQMRAQVFSAKEWDNRVYIYENDVLYAYAIPFVYGMGGRFWVNARYRINDTFSLYVRLSETVYQSEWAMAHDKKRTRTDVHALLRVRL